MKRTEPAIIVSAIPKQDVPARYEYQGRPYQSLSAIARAITGTRWNGWMFFGLRKAGA